MHNSISSPPPSPVTIGNCLGWVYRGRGKGAVLLCGPIGFEALCVRQSWHALAGLIAATGPSVLRLDYPGEGDSLDRDVGSRLLDAAAVTAQNAVATLTNTTGSEKISLIAMRMGVPIAARACSAGASLDRLVLLEPVFDGRSHLRELKATARILNELRPSATTEEGALNICGYVLSSDDVADVGAIKLDSLPDCRELHIFQNSGKALPAWLPEHHVHPFDDFAAMNVTPTQAQVPIATFTAIAALFRSDEQAPKTSTQLSAAALRHQNFNESAIRFGTNGRLAGILCEPASGATEAPIVHILNAGSNAHIGWARMGISHARALALQGIATLRYDFSGIGDSEWLATNARDLIYAPQHIEDALEAVAETAQRGYARAVLSGLCSGGYIAFQAGARDARVAGVIAANTLRLIWHPHDKLDDTEASLVQSDTVYREKLLSPAEWKRLISGGISLARILKVLTSFSRRGLDAAMQIAGVERLDADNRAVRANLKKLVENGVSVALVHSDRDQSAMEAQRHFGPDARWAVQHPGVRRIFIENADHELSQPWARDRLLEVIIEQVAQIRQKG